MVWLYSCVALTLHPMLQRFGQRPDRGGPLDLIWQHNTTVQGRLARTSSGLRAVRRHEAIPFGGVVVVHVHLLLSTPRTLPARSLFPLLVIVNMQCTCAPSSIPHIKHPPMLDTPSKLEHPSRQATLLIHRHFSKDGSLC
jgi:hypothetical protein